MQSSYKARIEALEKAISTPQEQGQRVERFTAEGEEFVQLYWDGEPTRVYYAWQWDAWDEVDASEAQYAKQP